MEQSVLVEAQGYAGPALYLDHDEEDQTTLRYLKKWGKPPLPLRRRYLDDIYGILEGVRLGLGRAVVPLHLLHGEERLRILNPERKISSPVYLIHYRQPYFSKLDQLLLKTLQDGCRSFL